MFDFILNALAHLPNQQKAVCDWNNGAGCTMPYCGEDDYQKLVGMYGIPDRVIVMDGDNVIFSAEKKR